MYGSYLAYILELLDPFDLVHLAPLSKTFQRVLMPGSLQGQALDDSLGLFTVYLSPLRPSWFRPVLPCTPLSFDCVLLLTTCTVLLWDISKNTGAYSYDSYMRSLYATTVSLNNIARESDSSYSRSTFGIADLERVLECVQTTGTVLVVTLIRTLEYVLHLFLCVVTLIRTLEYVLHLFLCCAVP